MLSSNYSLYKDYEKVLIENEAMAKELREVKYNNRLIKNQLANAEKRIQELEKLLLAKDGKLSEKDFEIQRLNARLNTDGTNSNLPTSQTPICKKKVIPNTRQKTDRKKGGQSGHEKHSLKCFSDEEINETEIHTTSVCPHCNSKNITKTDETIYKDELDYKIIIIKRRHYFPKYVCNECKCKFHKPIPTNLKEENQYGPEVQSTVLTLANYSNVPINKIQGLISGLTDNQICMSTGYIAKLQSKAADGLRNFEKEVYSKIINLPVLHWDDTVITVDTKRACLRFYGTEKIALFKAHEHKDLSGMLEDKVLLALAPNTIVVHDHLLVNYNDMFDYKNAECNRHLLGDLQKNQDILNHSWTQELSELLRREIHNRNELVKKGVDKFDIDKIKEINDNYDAIMLKAYEENKGAKGKYYENDERTLINRLIDYKENYLMWINNFEIPTTNNLAERALRPAKSKLKTSGQFCNIESAKKYALIRTYVTTCSRNGVNVYEAMQRLCEGNPYTLEEVLKYAENSENTM